jgi:fatty acid desaturase
MNFPSTNNYADNVDDVPELKEDLQRFPRAKVIREVRRLSRVNGWRSTGWIAFHWTVILLSGGAAIVIGQWWAYLLSMVVIATRQQALGVMMHDGAHYLLYKNRVVNDVVSDLFVAFPIGLSTDLYRGTHFRHHLHTNSADDPDLAYQRKDADWFVWPKSRLACAWVLFKSFLGLNVFKGYEPYRLWSPWLNIHRPLKGKPRFPLRSRVLLVLTTIAIYGVVIGGGIIVPAILLWMVPGFTLLNLVNRMRATAEHIGAIGTHELNATRTVVPNLLERLTIAPMGVSYHLEHHLFPSVPGPRLAELHRLLMQDDDYRARALVTYSYTGVLRELMRCNS